MSSHVTSPLRSRRLYEMRRLLLTPPRRAVELDVRGFQPRDDLARARLEGAGHSFLDGYAIAAQSRCNDEVVAGLEALKGNLRGFAYEGAAMALAILDGLPFSHNHHVHDLLDSQGSRHIYMIYVGAGWALARLPRRFWAAATGGLTDGVLQWLALDGYGFHQAYFKTSAYVHGRREEPAFPWPAEDPTSYAQHAIDQGIGRALWFVEGADPARVAARVRTFPASRQPDLVAGVGLAATYAGGADEDSLRALVGAAGRHVLALQQGATFAAEARRRAGNLEAETEIAAQTLLGLHADEAADLALDAWPTDASPDDFPSYEAWRRRIMTGIGARHGIG